jgi:hypothetical protein
MSVDLIPEDDLRAALRPYRVDPDAFEAAVRERLKAAETQRDDEPLARLSPWLRSAAAFLPLEVLAGCKGTAAAAKLAPVGGAYKLLSYLAFPAISLFVLLGATIFSIAKIRNIQDEDGSKLSDQMPTYEAISQWWRQHMWGAIVVHVATLLLMLVGATWILFLFYLVSFGILLFVLGSFAKLGLGNRQVIGRSCGSGLMFLAQCAMFSGIGYGEIHFVAQNVASGIFMLGVLALTLVGLRDSQLIGQRGLRRAGAPHWAFVAFMTVLLIPLIAWMLSPLLWPATPARMKSYVESFEEAPYSSSSWRQWEIVARWAIDSKLNPDLSKPRQLLAKEIAGEQNPFILGSALRVGLLPADQIGQLKEYESRRRDLLAAPPGGMKPQVITSLEYHDWVIRAAALRNELSPEERDRLEQRLYATLKNISINRYAVPLKTSLEVTELLDVIERPIDRDEYREVVHDWLRRFHVNNTGWGQLAGGFKQYPNLPYAYLDSTSDAVRLMEIYGVPDDLNVNWVRSYLRPGAYIMDQKWIAAATLDRLNHLPGVTRPTWLDYLYYERSLLAAAVLVGLCFYATLSSPKLKETAAGNTTNLMQDGEMDQPSPF